MGRYRGELGRATLWAQCEVCFSFLSLFLIFFYFNFKSNPSLKIKPLSLDAQIEIQHDMQKQEIYLVFFFKL